MSGARRVRALGVAGTRARVEGATIEVPGSSANLGAGFDTLAVAVQLYLRVTVRRVLDGPRNTLQCTFGGTPLEGDNYVARSVTAVARRERLDFPALDVEIASDIPMQAGLGSSAAATVAGLLVYERLAASDAADAAEAPALDLLGEGTAFE